MLMGSWGLWVGATDYCRVWEVEQPEIERRGQSCCGLEVRDWWHGEVLWVCVGLVVQNIEVCMHMAGC